MGFWFIFRSATTSSTAVRRSPCLAAARSTRSSDSPPDCHSLLLVPLRYPQGEGWCGRMARQRHSQGVATQTSGLYYLRATPLKGKAGVGEWRVSDILKGWQRKRAACTTYKPPHSRGRLSRLYAYFTRFIKSRERLPHWQAPGSQPAMALPCSPSGKRWHST